MCLLKVHGNIVASGEYVFLNQISCVGFETGMEITNYQKMVNININTSMGTVDIFLDLYIAISSFCELDKE